MPRHVSQVTLEPSVRDNRGSPSPATYGRAFQEHLLWLRRRTPAVQTGPSWVARAARGKTGPHFRVGSATGGVTRARSAPDWRKERTWAENLGTRAPSQLHFSTGNLTALPADDVTSLPVDAQAYTVLPAPAAMAVLSFSFSVLFFFLGGGGSSSSWQQTIQSERSSL